MLKKTKIYLLFAIIVFFIHKTLQLAMKEKINVEPIEKEL
tara:strand:+ start:813 stop:932 length:120 start_codon:yes stop_codon:yes gene_type:complete